MEGNFLNRIIQYFKISLIAVLLFAAAYIIVLCWDISVGISSSPIPNRQRSLSPSITFYVHSQKRSRWFLIYRRMIWVLEL